MACYLRILVHYERDMYCCDCIHNTIPDITLSLTGLTTVAVGGSVL